MAQFIAELCSNGKFCEEFRQFWIDYNFRKHDGKGQNFKSGMKGRGAQDPQTNFS
jgi:hypothetical protein